MLLAKASESVRPDVPRSEEPVHHSAPESPCALSFEPMSRPFVPLAAILRVRCLLPISSITIGSMFDFSEPWIFLQITQAVAFELTLRQPLLAGRSLPATQGGARAGKQVPMSNSRSLRKAHDALFGALVSDAASAASLIRRYAPRELVRILSGAPPRLLESSLISPQRGRIQADAVFEVEVLDGRKVLVQILFEHLSAPDPGIALRLLEYMTGSWRRHGKAIKPGTMPVIIPIVICHGPRHCAVPNTFLELVDAPNGLAESLQPSFSTSASRSMICAGYPAWNSQTIPPRGACSSPCSSPMRTIRPCRICSPS